MNDLVVLRHPTLPPEQTITVHRRRMGAHLSAGWEEVQPEPKPAESEQPTESAPTRRSRKNSEEQ